MRVYSAGTELTWLKCRVVKEQGESCPSHCRDLEVGARHDRLLLAHRLVAVIKQGLAVIFGPDENDIWPRPATICGPVIGLCRSRWQDGRPSAACPRCSIYLSRLFSDLVLFELSESARFPNKHFSVCTKRNSCMGDLFLLFHPPSTPLLRSASLPTTSISSLRPAHDVFSLPCDLRHQKLVRGSVFLFPPSRFLLAGSSKAREIESVIKFLVPRLGSKL